MHYIKQIAQKVREMLNKPSRRKAGTRREAPWARLALEALEQRELPAVGPPFPTTLLWVSGAGKNWSVAANWVDVAGNSRKPQDGDTH